VTNLTVDLCFKQSIPSSVSYLTFCCWFNKPTEEDKMRLIAYHKSITVKFTNRY